MNQGFFAIAQKELRRFFTDRRMVLTTCILPGLLIYLIYSFMGGAMTSNLTVSSDYNPVIYSVNLPDSLRPALETAGLEFEPVDLKDAEGIKEAIENRTADVLILFPTNFDAELSASLEGSGAAPNIELFYNSTRVESSSLFNQTYSLFSAYKESLQQVFTLNGGEQAYDLASEQDSAGFMFASLLPMLLMIFLYSGCMSVAPESIAGEKERGTIATLLVTPLKRWELALGKILSLCAIALLSGASSFVGVMLSLPKLLQVEPSGGGGDGAALLTASVYGVQDYLMLLIVILSTVILFVGLISLISAFARTIKEATTMVMPLMMVVLLVAATAMFQTSSESNLMLYLVPVYNSVQSMVSVFGFSADPLAITLTVAANLVLSGLCVIALTRMFESERIIFSK